MFGLLVVGCFGVVMCSFLQFSGLWFGVWGSVLLGVCGCVFWGVAATQQVLGAVSSKPKLLDKYSKGPKDPTTEYMGSG